MQDKRKILLDMVRACVPALVDLTALPFRLGNTDRLTMGYYQDSLATIPVSDPTRIMDSGITRESSPYPLPLSGNSNRGYETGEWYEYTVHQSQLKGFYAITLSYRM